MMAETRQDLSRDVTDAVVMRRIGHRAVLKVSGPLDAAAAARIGLAFWDAVEAGAREIWLDIGTTTVVRRVGLDALGRCADDAYELNRKVVVICPGARPGSAIADACRTAGIEMYHSMADAHYGS